MILGRQANFAAKMHAVVGCSMCWLDTSVIEIQDLFYACLQGAAVTDPAPAKKETAAKKQAAKKEQKEPAKK